MPPRSLPAVDPVFAGIAEAIYGDVDPREIAKFAPGSSDLHSDQPMTAAQAKRQKRVAETGLAATGVAGAAGLHAVTASIGEQKRRMAEAKGIELPAAKVGRVAGALKRMGVKPAVAAGVIGGGLLTLHGVELASDAMGAHAQLKQLNQANKQINKAFRLKPLNSLPMRVPSLRAKRPKLNFSPANPRTRSGLYQPMSKSIRSVYRGGRATLRNVYRTTEHARGTTEQVENATRSAAEASAKLGRLIPSPRTAALIGAGTVATLATAPAAGFYAGARAGVRSRDKKRPRAMPARVAKSDLADVTWTGEIAKVDADKRQVFGWASVSAVNGQEIVDLQGDIVPIEEMEKSAYRYVIDSRKGGDMHRRVAKFDEPLHTADMIESFVVTPEKLEKMGLPADSLPHGWWVGYHVNDDEQWNLVKSGARTGFSIHGKGTRAKVSKRNIPTGPGPAPGGIPVKTGKKVLVNSKGAKVAIARGLHMYGQGISTANRVLATHPTLPHTILQLVTKAADRPKIRVRAEQAIHPPAVKLHPVKSSAIHAMGYQPQTRRLAVEMRSRPGEPYEYKMGRGQAMDALNAPSKGYHYATAIRGKVKRAKGYSPADRARLFVDPVSKMSPLVIPLAAAGAGSAAVIGTNELRRQLANKQGAGIHPLGPYRHPMRTEYKHLKVISQKAGNRRLDSAHRLERKAAELTGPARVKVADQAKKMQGRGENLARSARQWGRAGETGYIRAVRAQRRANDRGTVRKDFGDKPPPRDGKLPGDNRKAEMARSRRTAGLSTAGLGYLVASRHSDVAPGMAQWITRSPKKIGEAEHATKIARRAARIGRLSTKGGAALVAGGLALAGEGAYSDLHNRGSFARTGNQAKKKFQSFGKAYDPEKNRHNRQAVYSGALSGGAVLAGGHAVKTGRKARAVDREAAATMEHANAAHLDLQNTLAAMRTASPEHRAVQTSLSDLAKPGATAPTKGQLHQLVAAHKKATENPAHITRATTAHNQAITHQLRSTELAGKAKGLRRISRGSALGTAALGAAALGVHTYDRHRGGRSYAY